MFLAKVYIEGSNTVKFKCRGIKFITKDTFIYNRFLLGLKQIFEYLFVLPLFRYYNRQLIIRLLFKGYLFTKIHLALILSAVSEAVAVNQLKLTENTVILLLLIFRLYIRLKTSRVLEY